MGTSKLLVHYLLLSLPLHKIFPLPHRSTSPFVPPSGQFPATRLNTQHHIRHPVALSTATTSISSADAIIHAALTRIPVQSAPALTPKYTAHQGHVDNFRPLPTTINSPINIEFLATCLLNYPNRNLANYLLNGFLYGFDIGYSGPVSSCRPQNLLSARNNPQVINTSINTEIQRGHTSGPFMVPPVFPLNCSPLGAVPKKDGSHRIILDLSSPRGVSINDGILKEDFTVRYTSFDDAVDLVRHLGKDCELGKMDIKHAFRLCPVSPFDWSLLGMYWNGAFYIDTRLPFGSRSSPYIFNTFADALAWILIYVFSIPYLLHYLDDFFSNCQIRIATTYVCGTACVSVTRRTIGPKQSHRPYKVFNIFRYRD